MAAVLGAHVAFDDPVEAAEARGLLDGGVLQVFLGDPQKYDDPKIDYPGGFEAFGKAAADAGVGLFVHAPYRINVASAKNQIRIPSRKLLQKYVTAAAKVGARGLIVHGGHLDEGIDPLVGFDNWRKAIDATSLEVPILIENTAGGENAMARTVDQLVGVWTAVSMAKDSDRVGFCLDTCHAHAAGIPLDTAVEQFTSVTGRLDLVHANDSRDPFGSGADRHANLGKGHADPAALATCFKAASALGAPLLLETKGGAEAQVEDLEWIRQRLGERLNA